MAEWLIYGLEGLFAYFLFIFLLMGSALDFKNPRDELGRLVFRRGFVIKKIYSLDFSWLDRFLGGKFEIETISIPKNICSFFWGLTGAMFLHAFVMVILGGIFVSIHLAANLVVKIGGLFLGYIPKSGWGAKGFKFHAYKRYGKNDEKKFWFAPWQIVLMLLAVLFILRLELYYDRAATFYTGMNRIDFIFFWIFAGIFGFAAMWMLYIIDVPVFRPFAFIGRIVGKILSKIFGPVAILIFLPAKEFIVAKKKKFCPQIVVRE